MRVRQLSSQFLMAAILLIVPAFGQECEIHFQVVRVTEDGRQANATTENMRNWWIKDGQKKFDSLCYAEREEDAQYLILWRGASWTKTTTYQVPSTSTSRTTGTIGGAPVNVDTTTTSERTETSEWGFTTVQVAVQRVSADGRSPILFEAERTGRWKWSAPDKNALEDALKAIESGFKNSESDSQSGLATRK